MRRRSFGRAAALLLLAVPGAVAAQTPSASTSPLRGGDVGLVHLEPRPGSAAVALVLAFPVGSAADPEGMEGATRGLAGTAARRVESALGPDGGRIDVEVTPQRTHLRVLALPERWEAAWAALEDAAFGAAPTSGELAEASAALEEALVFQSGAPIVDVQRETRALLHGAGAPATRPPEGTLPGVQALTVGALETLRRASWRRADAALAVVGDVSDAEARRRLGLPATSIPAVAHAGTDSLAAGDTTAARDTLAAPAAVARGPYVGALPWQEGQRQRIVEEVTSSWIAVAYPIPADLPRTAVELVAHRLTEELNPSPPDPGVYSSRVQVAPVPDGHALVIEVAVVPDAASRWEARVLAAVEALTTPVAEEFFLWQRRRFRSAALLREAAPEGAAARMADDLLERGGVRALGDALWRLDAATLAAAAAALGPPRILVYGPDLAGG